MKLPLLLRHSLASPVLFLLAIGGAIALADLWMRSQPRPSKPARPNRATKPRERSVRARRRRRIAGAAA